MNKVISSYLITFCYIQLECLGSSRPYSSPGSSLRPRSASNPDSRPGSSPGSIVLARILAEFLARVMDRVAARILARVLARVPARILAQGPDWSPGSSPGINTSLSPVQIIACAMCIFGATRRNTPPKHPATRAMQINAWGFVVFLVI